MHPNWNLVFQKWIDSGFPSCHFHCFWITTPQNSKGFGFSPSGSIIIFHSITSSTLVLPLVLLVVGGVSQSNGRPPTMTSWSPRYCGDEAEYWQELTTLWVQMSTVHICITSVAIPRLLVVWLMPKHLGVYVGRKTYIWRPSTGKRAINKTLK